MYAQQHWAASGVTLLAALAMLCTIVAGVLWPSCASLIGGGVMVVAGAWVGVLARGARYLLGTATRTTSKYRALDAVLFGCVAVVMACSGLEIGEFGMDVVDGLLGFSTHDGYRFSFWLAVIGAGAVFVTVSRQMRAVASLTTRWQSPSASGAVRRSLSGLAALGTSQTVWLWLLAHICFALRSDAIDNTWQIRERVAGGLIVGAPLAWAWAGIAVRNEPLGAMARLTSILRWTLYVVLVCGWAQLAGRSERSRRLGLGIVAAVVGMLDVGVVTLAPRVGGAEAVIGLAAGVAVAVVGGVGIVAAVVWA
ncbi:uncharacterized protein AMSG_11753 [Thecamonas trahens ATCC 50062]|uniref:Uncharacterized protein n=1 Tax=Thecamonas trahens ATCC 50062 TaxID=461836 RepID=A0A0L0D3F3_THETB|nr:hypothetical protein AMSG_11753 [Thecamonas trahens ATCC 50062]KNC46715.1 hypothetical protein AMSG_11753 [Thecamonas trahens ATCC 50062]|eukprot:XP_013760502.1 hypothetical protein AMSG_11753 [Thecamonas trahens ATCC 50062]